MGGSLLTIFQDHINPEAANEIDHFALITTAYDTIDVGILIVDGAGKVVFANRAATETVGGQTAASQFLGWVLRCTKATPRGCGCGRSSDCPLYPGNLFHAIRDQKVDRIEPPISIRPIYYEAGPNIFSISARPLSIKNTDYAVLVLHTESKQPLALPNEDIQRSSNEILRNQEFFRLLSFYGAELLANPATELKSSLRRFLRDVSDRWDADRVMILRAKGDFSSVEIPYDWTRNENRLAPHQRHTVVALSQKTAQKIANLTRDCTVVDSQDEIVDLFAWCHRMNESYHHMLSIPLGRYDQTLGIVVLFAVDTSRWRDLPPDALTMVGQIVAGVFASQDFDTQVRRMSELSNQARIAAESASEAKSEFLSSMSHELRTPLNAIIGFGQVLESDPGLNGDQRDYVQEVVRGGQHLLRLVNELLDLSRIEIGLIDIALEAVDCDAVIRDSVGIVKEFADREGITISVEKSRGVTALADKFRLRQVIINLLSNAIKYNRRAGSVKVSVSERAAYVSIHVRDTGEGIPVEKMDELFVQFNRLGRERSGIDGAGIGLALSSKLTHLMGGTILVESQVGSGSDFCVELPRYDEHERRSVRPERKDSAI